MIVRVGARTNIVTSEFTEGGEGSEDRSDGKHNPRIYISGQDH